MPWMTRLVVYRVLNAMDEKDAKEHAEDVKEWLLKQHGVQNVVITTTFFMDEKENEC